MAEVMEDAISLSLQAASFYRCERADEYDPVVYTELLDSFVGGSFEAMIQHLVNKRSGNNAARKKRRSLDILATRKDLLRPKLCETCGKEYFPVQGNTQQQRFCGRRCATTLPGNKCNRGHEFTPENTRIYGKGYRSCKACEKIRKTKQKIAA